MKTLECIEEPEATSAPSDSKFRNARRFLREAGRVAWKTQKTPSGKFWAILFVLGNFSIFEWLMGSARFLGGERYFPALMVIPVIYLFLSLTGDIYIIGHFAENYRWKDRVRFQSFLTDRISHRGTRKTLSAALIVISLFLCGAITYMERMGIFILLTQDSVSFRFGKKLLYAGAWVRIALTYIGVHFLAKWLGGIF